MELVLQKDNIQDQFDVAWEKYVLTVLNYARSHETPTKDLRHALRDLDSEENDDCKTIDSLLLICNYL